MRRAEKLALISVVPRAECPGEGLGGPEAAAPCAGVL